MHANFLKGWNFWRILHLRFSKFCCWYGRKPWIISRLEYFVYNWMFWWRSNRISVSIQGQITLFSKQLGYYKPDLQKFSSILWDLEYSQIYVWSFVINLSPQSFPNPPYLDLSSSTWIRANSKIAIRITKIRTGYKCRNKEILNWTKIFKNLFWVIKKIYYCPKLMI